MTTTTKLPALTSWCEECDGPCAIIICNMADERTCAACHEWLECPCQEEGY